MITDLGDKVAIDTQHPDFLLNIRAMGMPETVPPDAAPHYAAMLFNCVGDPTVLSKFNEETGLRFGPAGSTPTDDDNAVFDAFVPWFNEELWPWLESLDAECKGTLS